MLRAAKRHIYRYYKARKAKEVLPPWKEAVHSFNEKYFKQIEKFIEFLIPWLVLLLLFIVLGELAQFNPFEWHWVEIVHLFVEEFHDWILLLDQIIIAFFIGDLYFSFFKKATFWGWVKIYWLDILAVFPFGFIVATAGIGEAQSAIHVGAELEKEAARIAREAEGTARLARQAEAASKVSRSTRFTKMLRFIPRIPRLLRLHRLTDFMKAKKSKRAKKKKKK